jgi:hypothetical protein
MKTATNVNVYAVEGGERRPILSLSPDDPMAAAKVVAKMAIALRDHEQRGVPHPDFVIVKESRSTGAEGGPVLEASFQILDANLDAIGKPRETIGDCFPVKGAPEVKQPSPEEVRSARLSK